MTLDEAMQIVLELAEENIIDDPDMIEETGRQQEAVRKVTEIYHAGEFGNG